MKQYTAKHEKLGNYIACLTEVVIPETGEIAYIGPAADLLAGYEDLEVTPEQLRELDTMYYELAKELGEYKKNGTVEEFKALKEKNEPKKVDEEYCCPICHTCGMDDDGIAGDYCTSCGQALDWSE